MTYFNDINGMWTMNIINEIQQSTWIIMDRLGVKKPTGKSKKRLTVPKKRKIIKKVCTISEKYS